MTDRNRETRWYKRVLGSWNQKTTLAGVIGGETTGPEKNEVECRTYFEFQPAAKAVRVRHERTMPPAFLPLCPTV
jgi:hypothetical protein